MFGESFERGSFMRKYFGKLVALVLTVCVAFQFQVPTLAAQEEKQYVSEVIISYGEGDSAEGQAKAWLTDNGYEVVDTNLNYGAESNASNAAVSWLTGARRARAVYLGYKTTTDPEQAITSLKAMNMTGNYSFDEYQEVLDDMKGEIASFMDDFNIVLKEWRENYQTGRGKAIESYALLNLMYSPDNDNTKMGDLLLNETKEEMGDSAYNKLSAEEKLEHADMTTIMLEGNSDAIKYIEQILAMGCDTDTESTWLDRLSSMGTYDDMMDEIEAAAEENDETFLPSEAAAALSTKYDATAQILAAQITELQKLFIEYLESGATLTDSQNKVNSFINKNGDSGDLLNWFNIGTMYENLGLISYPSNENPDRTVRDFLMQDFDPDSAESRQELYPMAAALSEGQNAAIMFVSLSELITQGILTDEEAMEGVSGIEEYIDQNDSISVFSGVDRSMFDSSSTALTSSAREVVNATQNPYNAGVAGSPYSLRTVISAAIFATGLLATVGCGATAMLVFDEHAFTITETWMALERRVGAIAARQFEYDSVSQFTDFVSKMTDKVINDALRGDKASVKFIQGYEGAVEYSRNFIKANQATSLYNGFRAASCVLLIVTIAVGIWTVVSGVMDLYEYYDRDMDLYPIPENIVDESETSDGEKTYTYYKAVQCNRQELFGDDEDRAVLKNNADLNGDLGKEWLALYYTKDSSAGQPIVVTDLSGFTVITGKDATPSDMTALTIFDKQSPVNLTNSEWVWNDVTKGLFLYYTVDGASDSASIFVDTTGMIVCIAIGVVIAAVFFTGGYMFCRRRKRKSKVSVSA